MLVENGLILEKHPKQKGSEKSLIKMRIKVSGAWCITLENWSAAEYQQRVKTNWSCPSKAKLILNMSAQTFLAEKTKTYSTDYFPFKNKKGLGRQKQTASISNPTSIKEVETVYSTNKETAGSKASRNKDHCSNSYSWKNTWSVS